MADLGYIETDILLRLGWSQWQIDDMTDALAQDIIADYAVGIERGPNLTVPSPSSVGYATFTQGVSSDVIDIAQGARETLSNLGEAVKTLSKNAPLLIVGFAALALVLFLK